jgi:branched-chain amino acid transport system permease protein
MKTSKIVFVVLGIVVLAVFPLYIKDPYILRLTVMSGLFILLASAHNLLMKVGQLSLGPVAFYGVGAYVSAILTTRYHMPFLVGFVAAGLAAALCGWVIGKLTLKMRSAYFVVTTMGFAEFFRQVAINWTEMTNGPMGITAVPPPAQLFNSGYAPYYYAILILVSIIIYGLYRMENSTIGRAMKAIRENEPLAQSVGIDNYRYMMLATLVSSSIIGVAGSFYSGFFQFVGPEILNFDLTVTIIVMVVAGGRATLAGPILGAIIFTILPEMLRATLVWRMVIYGALLIVIMLFVPDGIMPGIRLLWQKISSRLKALPQINRFFLPAPTLAPVAQTNEIEFGNGRFRHSFGDNNPGSSPSDLLTIKNLCVYFGGVRAVDDISVTVKPGEILSIIGPNGAGKTTILNAITRFGPITSGDILHRDQSLKALPAHEIARRGVVRTFQHTNVFSVSTTHGNLKLGHNSLEPDSLVANIIRSRVCVECECDMEERAQALLDFLNLQQYADTPARALPYGHQRLLEIGVSLAAVPEILLLDEPAAGLNSSEVNGMIKVIQNIRQKGITIVLVEHDMKLVMGISDHILVLDHGKQIAWGKPDMIRNDEQVVSAYLGRRK